MAVSHIKHMIAVASGKGGVGKSTLAVNLALAYAKKGLKVGLLDADIYGPSQPTLLSQANAKPTISQKKIYPIESHGILSMSIGYLVASDAALMWRGPMIGKVLQQLWIDTQWGELDCLVVDLPPGTGDIQLTLCQKMPLTGAIIVTTPQDLALLDVRRALEMFLQLKVPVLGIVENMSIHQCSACGHQEPLFGAGGGKVLAAEYNIPLLANIPLDPAICEGTNGGKPIMEIKERGDLSLLFTEIAEKALAKSVENKKDYSSLFPKIVVE